MSRLLATLVIVAVVTVPPAVAGGGRRMAVTIDDLPVTLAHRHTLAEQREITGHLLAALAEHGVPAIGFVNEDKLETEHAVDPAKVELLRGWLAAGHELGNHGYSHLDLHRVEVDVWESDVLRGERVLRRLLSEVGAAPRFFRHPFLHTGRSLEIRDRTTAFLTRHGYRVAPVTVDNSEWVFGRAWVETESDEVRRRLGEAYLEHMQAVTDFFETQARVVVGEPIPQVLLIHAYALNGEWLDDLLGRYSAAGWRFVSLEEALAHPAYSSRDSYSGPSGLSWLHRWAWTRSPEAELARETEAPAWVMEAAGLTP